MKKLWKFELDWGRMGTLEGLFVSEPEPLMELIGKEIYFGECLGKHSEVVDKMEMYMFNDLGAPADVISWFECNFPHGFGTNPLGRAYPFSAQGDLDALS